MTGAAAVLLTPSEFAPRSRLSAKALRLYDPTGLLRADQPGCSCNPGTPD
jgi:hypothetical protein